MALRAHTDSGDHSKSPEKMKHFKDSVQYVEEEIMNEWDGSGEHASAKVTLEYIENLKSAHAKVLECELGASAVGEGRGGGATL